MRISDISRQVNMSRIRPSLMAAALFCGALGFAGAVLGEGGGDPIGSQPIDWAAQRQAERSGLTTDDTRAAQRAAGAVAGRSNATNTGDRSRGYRGRQYDTRRYSSNDRRHYDYNQRYAGRSHAYRSDPYWYAPPPLAYDPNPSPGISLFFNF